MTDRLTPEREAEIAAAVAEMDADRTLSFGTWTASPVTEKSTLPPEQAFAVEDIAQFGGAKLRGSVGVFGDERHAAFTALARTAVPALLAELAAVRAERDAFRDQRNAVFATNERLLAEVQESDQARLQAENETRTAKRELAAVRAERDEFCDRVDTLTAVAKGNKRHVQEMFLELQKAHARIRELERPAIEAARNAIRRSYTGLIAQAEQDRDPEGAFALQAQLRDREAQWKRDDEEAGR